MLPLLSILITAGAWAEDVDELGPELIRLEDRMVNLAQRSVWDGVDRAYEDILALGLEPKAATHVLGADAAHARGDVGGELGRLDHLMSRGSTPELEARVATLLEEFGKSDLSCAPCDAPLVAVEPPFRPDLKAAITFASAKLTETGTFQGYLPAGDYTIDGKSFASRPGERAQSVAVGADNHNVPVRLADFPPKAKAAGGKVKLNGGGTYVEGYNDVYVGVLYLTNPTDDGTAAIDDTSPKRIALTFVYRDFSSEQLIEHLTGPLEAQDNGGVLRPRIQQLQAMMHDIEAGQALVFDWNPTERSVIVSIDDDVKGILKGADFMKVIWRAFLGPAPVSKPLKAGMLGIG